MAGWRMARRVPRVRPSFGLTWDHALITANDVNSLYATWSAALSRIRTVALHHLQLLQLLCQR